MTEKMVVNAISYDDDFGLPAVALDIRVLDEQATVADMLAAIDAFAEQSIADCRGCDSCCRERAPLIAADIPALAALLPASEHPAHQALRAFADLNIDKAGAVDITLKRDADSACCFLDTKQKICSQWPARLFVCRSHFCLPRSDRFSQLREEVANAGENELVRLLLAEEAAGAEPITPDALKNLLRAADYPPTAISGANSYQQMRLADFVSHSLWQQLLQA